MGNFNGLGATQSRDSADRIYLNLRTGKISQIAKEPTEGFGKFVSETSTGTKTYYAKTWENFTCFIDKITWNESEFDGKKIVGWHLSLNIGDGKEYILQINSGDRPYQILMNLLPNVDFNNPVRIIAFMGKNNKNNKPQKVLLFTQNLDATAKDWVKPAFEEKWLSTMLQEKIEENLRLKKAGKPLIALNEQEKANLAYDVDGKYDATYPYITQNADGTWNFSNWTNFLIRQMKNEVIPRCEDAYLSRRDSDYSEEDQEQSTTFEDEPSIIGGNDYRHKAEDDIPF